MASKDDLDLFEENLLQLQQRLNNKMKSRNERRVSFGDLITDRWETAKAYGFGEGTSCYDNVLIIGDVTVGKHTWIGPNVVLDGSGGLVIGDFCSISAGVQIYTHHTVAWATSLGEQEPARDTVSIGNGVYLGPNSIIQMGTTIGDKAVVGAMSFVNRDVAAGVKVWGVPARPAN